MFENGMNYLELEYEHLYNMRDQTMLFLKMIDIMKIATSRVYELCEGNSLADKELQERLLREREESYYPEKWVRSIDTYRALCPEDPMGLEG